MSPPDRDPGGNPGAHLDEEECLPFPIFMAELELLVGNSKRGKPDGVQLLELLQKLVATIPRTDKSVLKHYQRQCEAMLYDVLAHGIGAAVRRLIYSCFSSLYAHGDAVSIYTRVNTLQSYLASKEGMSRSTAESIRVGLLDLLAHLHMQYGRMLGNSAPESMSIALRTVSKSGNQAPVRCAALRLAAAVVRGLAPADRSAPAVQAEAWLIVQRHAKDRTCEEVREGCVKLLGALCAAGGGPLWREGAYGAEEALRLCLTLTEDSVQAVRDAAYTAMGELAAASRPAAKSEAVTGEKRPAKKAAAERVVSNCVKGCLITPLLEAALHSKREACLGISRAWMAYLAAIRHQHQSSDQTADMLDVAGLLINAVNEAGRLVAETRLFPGADTGGELGAGLAGSELPPLQAGALYVLRRGVMGVLTEAGQRKLLERLANLLDKRLNTPAAVVTLEALAALLEAVGEVTDETAGSLEVLLQAYVTSSSAATRQQAAIAMAALAAAHPAAAARMLSGCLDTVASCAAQLAVPLSPAAVAAATAAAGGTPSDGHLVGSSPSLHTTSAPVADTGAVGATPAAEGAAPLAAVSVGPASLATASPPRPGTPNGGINGGGGAMAGSGRPMAVQRGVMDTCHGAALSASRLLLATVRSPLGCPARLQRRAMALAEDLVTGPGPELAFTRAICREVGFLLLGTLCALGVPQATRGPEEMAALWQTALGEAARRDLDERSLPQRPGVDFDLALQLWWRAVALQALSAYLAASQAGAPAGTSAAPSRSRSATALPLLSGSAVASFTFKQAPAGLPRIRSGSGPLGSGGTSAGAGAAGSAQGGEPDWTHLSTHLAPLVEPLVELLDTQSYLLEPAKARGGPAGILAGAAAMFILALVELHLRAPGGRISSSPSHTALLAKACLRPFRQGLTAAAADALTQSGLRGLLNSDDAPLGPWPPAADPLQDALRCFTGGRGAPQLPPWLSSEDYAALISGALSAVPSASGGASAGTGSAVGLFASAATGLPPAEDGDGISVADGSVAEDGAAGAVVAGSGPSLGAGAGAPEALGSSSSACLAHATFPQSTGLEAALLTVQLVLLGRQTAASPLVQQLQVLDAILNAVQASKTFARQSRDAAACRRLPLAVAAAVVALAGYGSAAMAARKSKAPLDPTDKVPEKLLQLAQALMPDDEAAAPVAAALSRATAETYAASAATGSETWALRVVRALATEVAASAAEGRDSQQRAVLALALGAAHRTRGGLAMQAAVASSAEALVAAGSRPGCAAAAAWVLHGLWLLACSAGGAFVPRVKTSLQLAQELLVSSFESPALRAACARLANASVAALGPEFSLGSLVYVRAKSLVAASGGGGHMPVADGGADGEPRRGGGSSNGAGGGDGGLGLVMFVQQIILFAPQAVPPAKHVPLLLSHLLSSQPDLRAASALTLRHLAERSAEALRPAEAAPMLFAALDRESDPRIAGQLRATITTILNANVVSAPSFWLDLLSDVVFAAGPPTAAAASGGGATDGSRGGAGDEDDDVRDARTGRSLSSSSGTKGPGRGRAPRSVREVLTAPHLRTRHYAADCLLRVIRVCVSSDERHRDPSAVDWHMPNRPTSSGGAAGSGARSDLLIAKTQVLVDMGFKLATCPLESLRPHGVRMLALLVQLFGDVPDPLLQGARLMEQYQAQVVSALRSSLGARQAPTGGLTGLPAPAAAPGSAGTGTGAAGGGAAAARDAGVQYPLLQIAGGVLATCFLDSGLAAGDAVVMRRLMELLSAPLSAWHTLRYEAYGEWVGARARVELLRAHAQCAAIAAAAAARGDALCAGIVAKAQEPHSSRLQVLWALLLQDHAVLCSQPEVVLAAYRSPLLEGALPEAATAQLSPPLPPPLPATTATAVGTVEEGPGEGTGNEGKMEDGGDTRGGEAQPEFGLTPAVAAVLRPVYTAACPAALAALAGRLPAAAQLAADAASRAQFRRLLEVGLMLLTDASARLALAVQEATRGAVAAAAAPGSSSRGGAPPGADGQPMPAVSASASELVQLREAASRLVAVLRALQRFLSSDYLTAVVRAAPAAQHAAGAPVAARGSTDAATPAAVAAAAAAASDGDEPLVPPAVLHDLLRALSAAALHALLPLHWALLAGIVPSGLAALLPGVAMPCCAMLREVCGAATEQSLGATCGAADGRDDAAEDDDDAGTRRRGSSSPGDEATQLPASPRAGSCNGEEGGRSRFSEDGTCSSPVRHSGAEGSCVSGAAVEAVLLLASVCAPFPHGGVRQRRGGNGEQAAAAARASSPPRPPYVACPAGEGSSAAGGLPGCLPLPALAPETATGLTQCTVQVLAAAQQLIRRSPWSSLAPHVGSLLELPLRLILTAAPGTPGMAAAQRYIETTTAALLARPDARGPPGTAPQGADTSPAAVAASPATFALAAVVALADTTEQHLRALQSLRLSEGDGDGGGTEESASAAAGTRLQGRLSALVAALLSSAATVEPTEPSTPLLVSTGSAGVTSPSRTPPHVAAASAGRAASGGSGGSGAPALLPPHRGARSFGSGPSRLLNAASSRSPAAAVTPAAAQVPPPPPTATTTTANPAGLSPAAVRDCVLSVLAAAFAEPVPASAALVVLEAVRAAVQEAAAEDPGSARGQWARLLVWAVVPPAADRVAALLARAKQPLTGADQSLVAECLKVLVLAATLAGAHGSVGQEGVMQVLVPLLVEVAAPSVGAAAATPGLRDLAIKLITSLPAAAAGAAFKAQLAAQPAAAKLRLQGALREAAAAAAAVAATASAAPVAAPGGAAAAAAGGAAAGAAVASSPVAVAAPPAVAGAGARRPTIQLKTTFALPLPGK